MRSSATRETPAENRGLDDRPVCRSSAPARAGLRLFVSHSSRLRDEEVDDMQARANWRLLQSN